MSRHDPVDVLFVIDHGPSMTEEQALLGRELPRMFETLVRGAEGELGRIDAVSSLRIGIATSDLGAGSGGAFECSVRGDDGVLRRNPACGSTGERFVWHFDGFHDPARVIEELRCTAEVGATGCVIAQPLEAGWKALSLDRRSDDPGFHRPEAYLLVVIITDKDDCSLAAPAFGGHPAAACASSESLQAIERYVAAFPERAGVLIIAGLPPDLELRDRDEGFVLDETETREAYYARVSSDARLTATTAEPSCDSSFATAHAPRRLLEFARQLGPRASVQSLCREDFTRGLYRFLHGGHRHGRVLGCVPRRLAVGPPAAECRMTWELPPQVDPEQPLTPSRCEERTFLGVPSGAFPQRSESGRVLCEVQQVEEPAADGGSEAAGGDGFYFASDSFECGNRPGIAFTPAAKPPHGVTVRLTCTQSACPPDP